MSPLAPANTRGYADYQRLANWDSGVLFSDQNNTTAGSITTNVFDVGRYAYLAGKDQVTLGAGALTVVWFTDAAGAVACGARQFNLSSNMGGAAQYRLPNLGPFVRLSWGALGGANFTHNSVIFATNRYHPLEFVPEQSSLIVAQAAAFGASGTITLNPGDYYAGPVSISTVAGQAGLMFAELLDGTNTNQRIAEWDVAGNAHDMRTIVMPAGAWRIGYSNTNAVAGVLAVRVVPSATGST